MASTNKTQRVSELQRGDKRSFEKSQQEAKLASISLNLVFASYFYLFR